MPRNGIDLKWNNICMREEEKKSKTNKSRMYQTNECWLKFIASPSCEFECVVIPLETKKKPSMYLCHI